VADESPVAFFDLSWLAVKSAPPEAIIEVLGLSDPRPATWRQGLNATFGDYWDFSGSLLVCLSRVFIAPEVADWRLAIGGWLGDGEPEAPARSISAYCKQLSREFGEAYAFTTQGRMDWYSWCLARHGEVYRRFLWNGAPQVDVGSPTPAERVSREEAAAQGQTWRPWEGVVMSIAGECSIDPGELGSMRSTGSGYLGVTACGREVGVPSRPLD
jgi:hypothetical protein